MVVLGVDDLRCPPSQGREFHRALKARGIPTRYGTLVLDARLHNIFKTFFYTGKINDNVTISIIFLKFALESFLILTYLQF